MKRSTRVAVWLLMAVALVVGLGSVNCLRYYQLTKEGLVTKGWVTAKEPQVHQNVHYSYAVEGRTYNDVGHGDFGNPNFGQLRIGDPVTVSYLPRRPEVSCLGRPNDLLVNELIPIGLAALLFPTFAIWANSRRKTRG